MRSEDVPFLRAESDGGEVVGLREGVVVSRPANLADASFAELESLRAEAAGLGLEDFDADPLVTLRGRVERARQERHDKALGG